MINLGNMNEVVTESPDKVVVDFGDDGLGDAGVSLAFPDVGAKATVAVFVRRGHLCNEDIDTGRVS